MSQADLNLQLLMTLNDQVSAGMRRMMKDMQGETASSTRKMQELDRAAQKAGSTRMTGLVDSLRTVAREAKNVLDIITKVGAGAVAAGYAVSRMAAKPMDYEQNLTVMANTAFSDRKTKEGRLSGRAEIDAAIQHAVRYGGGTREMASAAMGTLSSENMDFRLAKGILPTLMSVHSQTGSDPVELARMASTYQRNLNLDEAGVKRMLGYSISAGQAGSFETRDMASWMPRILPVGATAGFTGEAGAKKLLAYSQAAMTTAGSPDEAGNNMVNLLSKVNAEDTSRDAKKLGIDLRGTLLQARANGMDSIAATSGLIDKVAMADPRYVELRKQLATQKDPGARKDTLSAMGNIMEGSAIGKLFQDRQAIMALLGIRFNPEVIARTEGKMAASGNEIALGHDVAASTTAYKVQALTNEKDISAQRVFNAAAPNALFEAMTATAQKFPGFTDSLVGATVAIIAMTAAAAAFAGMGLLGGKGGGLIQTGKNVMGNLGKITLGGLLIGGAAAPVLGAGYAGWEAGGWFNDKFVKGTAAGDKIGEMTARLMAFLGSDEAKRAIVINNTVQLDGKTVAESTNKLNAKEAKRR